MSLTGRCLCGSVTYDAGRPLPLATVLCNCADCQRSSGSSLGLVVVPVRSATLQVRGQTSTYRKDGDGGDGRDRVFCPGCGSQLFSVLAENDELTWIKAGTLDDSSQVRPWLEVFTDSAHAHTERLPARPRFRRSPPRVTVTALRPVLQALRRR